MRLVLCALAVVAVVGLSGCVVATAPVIGAIGVDQKGPVSAGDPSAKCTKTGTSKAEGIVFVGFGDASISAAMKSADIKKIHHVDNETLNILGIYARYQTVVYGE